MLVQNVSGAIHTPDGETPVLAVTVDSVTFDLNEDTGMNLLMILTDYIGRIRVARYHPSIDLDNA